MIVMSSKSKRIPTGSVFQKTYRDRLGKQRLASTWQIRYYSGGKQIEVSTGTESYQEALTMLRDCMAKAARYTDHGGKLDRVRIGHLLDLLVNSYRAKKCRSLHDTQLRIEKNLRPQLGNLLAKSLGTSVIRRYVQGRQKEGASAATINKELAWLRRAMNLGAHEDPPIVDRVPHFEMLPVDNARDGMLTHEEYSRVRDLLPPYARIALVIGYYTGARKGEIVSIKCADVDLKARRIRRPGAVTKNGSPHYLPIYGDMGPEIDMALSAASAAGCPYLLHSDGERVHDFKKSWKTACTSTGVPDALFHDLRRTAVTNMMESGLTEREAMEISGHKTRSVFDRYHIVSERRMQQMGQKLEAHFKSKDAIIKPSEPLN